jgi:hypothetical protein
VDSKFSLGLFISFILGAVVGGVGFIIDSQFIGIGFSILAIVWGILFLFPKSPIRKRCLSVSNKVSITVENYGGFPPKGNRQYLTVYKTLRVLSPIKVDKIILSIGRKKIMPRDWESYEVRGDESGNINFDRPGWLPNGNHSARLIVYTPDGYSKSKKFTLEVKD